MKTLIKIQGELKAPKIKGINSEIIIIAHAKIF